MPPVDGLLIQASPGEQRIALLSAGQVVEFRIERGAAAPGDILLGRVVSLIRPLGAALVEIGEPLPGFLNQAKDLSEGQSLPVQVTASARGTKGAELSAAPSLQGGLLAYSPFRPGFSLSRRIVAEKERARLSELLKPLRREDEGLVVRTQAEGAPEQALLFELEALRGQWRDIRAAMAVAAAPAPLRVPSALSRLLGEHAAIRRVTVDDRAALAGLREQFPGTDFQADAFADAADLLDQALAPRVALPGGGALEIGTVAGITVIDIDSGSGAPLEANLAAVPEIARQLRLRGLSGHILVDVIPMRERRSLAQISEALRQAVVADPTPTQVVGTTPLGMVELTRERRGSSLAECLMADASPRLSDDSLGLEALAALLREAGAAPGRRLALAAAPAVAATLRRRPAAVAETERRLGHALSLRDDAGLDGWRIIEE
ncbi:MAG TPA: ribonuclease E/G [Candidatus Sulfotelmatobacter sp.]|jgi:Rne/Rng family ribonuclease|nr:ribonuclease E/G [Candidatus Sulfotelmatobacter sp.]